MIDYKNKIIYVDNTTLGTFTCKEKCRLGSVMGYRPRVKKSSLTFGHAIHAAIAAYYNALASGFQDANHNWHFFSTDEERRRNPIAHAKIAFLKDLGLEGAELPVTLEGNDRRSIERGLGLIEAYFYRWQDDPYENVLKPSGEPLIEVGFKYPLTRFEDYDVVYVGYIDRIMRSLRTMRINIFETKTTTRALSQFILAANPNRQVTGYFPAAQTVVGIEDIYKCIWDCIFVSDRAANMQKALTNRFMMWGVDPEKDFIRHETSRTATDVSEFMLDAENDALEYCRWITSGAQRWTRNTTQCGIYGGCQFRQRCTHNVSPEEEPRFMEMDFEVSKWEPWRDIIRLEEADA